MKQETIENQQIEIKIIPSVDYVLKGIVNKLYLMFEFKVSKTRTEDEKARNPIELSMVLDRSGSMGGLKIENSRIAVNKVIDNLRDDDSLHLVMYDNEVDVVFKDGNLKNKSTLKNKVNEIRARGMTNLSGGVIKGHELINPKSKKNKRIFLFSDGLANEGVTSMEGVTNIIRKIHNKGINVSAFGIGDDFNEDMMKMIAEIGAGDFFFIENADSIPSIVSEGLDGLLTVVSSNTVLKVRGKEGVTVTKIYSYSLDGATLGDLRDDETRQVVLELEVKPEMMKNEELISYKLEYNATDDVMETRKHAGIFTIQLTDDEDLITKENEEVMVARELLEASLMEEQIVDYIDRGMYDEAISAQEATISNLEKISGLDEKGLIQEKLEMSGGTLDRLKRDKEMGDMRMSRKMASYSSYQSKYSKKRKK
ncbi:MAG: VWA domain-containing protein [Candidatus Heimdallarchaeota archaeon]|nr:VWA domain-containing protein [Candidatus Heimdallarchaeota archaeon]